MTPAQYYDYVKEKLETQKGVGFYNWSRLLQLSHRQANGLKMSEKQVKFLESLKTQFEVHVNRRQYAKSGEVGKYMILTGNFKSVRVKTNRDSGSKYFSIMIEDDEGNHLYSITTSSVQTLNKLGISVSMREGEETPLQEKYLFEFDQSETLYIRAKVTKHFGAGESITKIKYPKLVPIDQYSIYKISGEII